MKDIYKTLDNEPEFKSILNALDLDFYYRHINELHNNSLFALVNIYKSKGFDKKQIIKKIHAMKFRMSIW